jgi:hypothetical protein
MSVFQEFNIGDIDRSIFTTDRGFNMLVALRDEVRLDCIAHVLNTILHHTFDEKKLCPGAISKLLTACKSLVSYAKFAFTQLSLNNP